MGYNPFPLLPQTALMPEIILKHGKTNPLYRDFRCQLLLTWNFKHIANAEKWAIIEDVCGRMGYKMPRICSPLELLEHN
jgi:hypothetical protein